MSYYDDIQQNMEIKKMEINVIKRNGSQEPLNLEKIHKVVFWACEDITGVSASEVEIRAQLQFFDGVKTKDIHETLIKSASELINEETPNYQYVAARLINYQLRKEVYGGPDPIHLYDLVKRNVETGKYDPILLEKYSVEEWNELNNHIKHERDFSLVYAAMEQFRGKYLVKNRVTNEFYETPQVAYMLIAAILFVDEKENRIEWIKDYYDAISTHEISLPTPIMGGARTPTKQFSSCVLIDSDDSLESIIATDAAVVRYVSKKAGIGINAGRIRAEGSPIRGGEVVHTGMIPFLRKFQSSLKSCSQGGIRGGAGTIYYPAWHLEFEDLIVLKNNKGTENNRLRQMDYGVQLNKLMYKRLVSGENITFFSPKDIPGLLDAFYSDQEEFEKLYVEAENNPNIRKKTLPAIEVFSKIVMERKDTGRIYIQNIDNANIHGSFKEDVAPITMSNLCVTGDTSITILRVNGEIEDIPIMMLSDVLYEDDYGTLVLSNSVGSDEKQFKPILDFALTNPSAKIMKITDEETGYSIKCTPEHKIYTKNRGYVMAKNLKEDDILNIDK